MSVCLCVLCVCVFVCINECIAVDVDVLVSPDLLILFENFNSIGAILPDLQMACFCGFKLK